jgi:hypothetical protein
LTGASTPRPRDARPETDEPEVTCEATVRSWSGASPWRVSSTKARLRRARLPAKVVRPEPRLRTGRRGRGGMHPPPAPGPPRLDPRSSDVGALIPSLRLVLAALAAVGAEPESVAGAPPAIAGTWDVEHVAVDGQDAPHWGYRPDDPQLVGRILVIESGKVTFEDGKEIGCKQVAWPSRRATCATAPSQVPAPALPPAPAASPLAPETTAPVPARAGTTIDGTWRTRLVVGRIAKMTLDRSGNYRNRSFPLAEGRASAGRGGGRRLVGGRYRHHLHAEADKLSRPSQRSLYGGVQSRWQSANPRAPLTSGRTCRREPHGDLPAG